MKSPTSVTFAEVQFMSRHAILDTPNLSAIPIPEDSRDLFIQEMVSDHLRELNVKDKTIKLLSEEHRNKVNELREFFDNQIQGLTTQATNKGTLIQTLQSEKSKQELSSAIPIEFQMEMEMEKLNDELSVLKSRITDIQGESVKKEILYEQNLNQQYCELSDLIAPTLELEIEIEVEVEVFF